MNLPIFNVYGSTESGIPARLGLNATKVSAEQVDALKAILPASYKVRFQYWKDSNSFDVFANIEISANGTTGATNETGIARFRKILKKVPHQFTTLNAGYLQIANPVSIEQLKEILG